MTGVEKLLGLPENARIRQRFTKKEIVGQYEGTATSDARLLAKTIASAAIVGVLRPETIGVAAFEHAERRVDFIPVLDVILAEGTAPVDRSRVAELLHRSIPRPAIVALEVPGNEAVLSLALTRLSKSDSGRETSVIEASLLTDLDRMDPGALNVRRLNQADLWALYRDLVRTAAADGHPASAALTAYEAVALRRRLATLTVELESVARNAKRERNQQRRVDFNAQGRALRTEIETVRSLLYAPGVGRVAKSPESPMTDEGRNT